MTSTPANGMRPIHPGEILREEFLIPLAMTPDSFADRAGVDRTRLASILAGTTSLTADDARAIATAFGTSVEFWINLQAAFDERASAKDR